MNDSNYSMKSSGMNDRQSMDFGDNDSVWNGGDSLVESKVLGKDSGLMESIGGRSALNPGDRGRGATSHGRGTTPSLTPSQQQPQ